MNFNTRTTLGPSLVSTCSGSTSCLLERIIECKVPFSTDEYILISDMLLKTLLSYRSLLNFLQKYLRLGIVVVL